MSLDSVRVLFYRCIPKNTPGADWRVLQEIVAADPTREKFKVGSLVLSAVIAYAQ